MPVTAANSGGLDADYDSGPGGRGIWNGFNRQRALEFAEEGDLHGGRSRMQGAGQGWELWPVKCREELRKAISRQ